MAKLSYTERRTLEEYLQMGSGYVCNFSNRTFREFVHDSIRLDIYSEDIGGYGSKASRLRYFWSRQPDHVVGKLLRDLVNSHDGDEALKRKCMDIASRLLQSAPVQEAEVISVLSEREEFERLARKSSTLFNATIQNRAWIACTLSQSHSPARYARSTESRLSATSHCTASLAST